MFKKILIALLVLVVLVIVLGLFLPTQYEVSRSIAIDAPRTKVHVLVGDLKRWDDWTPWKKHDPSLAVTLGAKTTGEGASQSWKGKDGDGELVFTKCTASNGVEFDMSFDQGRMMSKGAVLYEQQGDGTLVTWQLKGDLDSLPPIMAGYFAAMMPSMVGNSFDEGLATLKAKVEGD